MFIKLEVVGLSSMNHWIGLGEALAASLTVLDKRSSAAVAQSVSHRQRIFHFPLAGIHATLRQLTRVNEPEGQKDTPDTTPVRPGSPLGAGLCCLR